MKALNIYLKNILEVFLIMVAIVTNAFSGQFLSDTLSVRDTLKKQDTVQRKKSEIEAIIYYKATDSISYQLKNRSMHLYGEADIKYKKMGLKSGQVNVDFSKNTLSAFGVTAKDTLDSTKTMLIKTPVLNDGGEEYKGTEVTYNFKTQQGTISMAKSKSDGQYYYGQKIKRLNPETYLVRDGIYTTCDDPHPHFYFYSKEMKVIADNMIITRWVWLHFGDVPFPIPLPFGVFPNQSGRRSGIIPPTYGERENYGRYFSNFGYFWAISDYLDANLTGTFYTRGGYAINSRVRYSKRYDFSGEVNLGYSSLHSGEESDKDYTKQSDYKISLVHQQQINPYSRFDANLSFVSSSYFNNNSYNLNEILNNQIVSNATYYKNFENSGNSISLSYNRVQNMTNGDISEVLPSFNFSMPQFYPFKRSVSSKSKSGESLEEEWYEQIGVNYGSQLQNRRTTLNNVFDTRGGINHDLSVNFSSKIGYFNISPRMSFNSKWYAKQVDRFSEVSFSGTDSIVTRDVDKIGLVNTFDLGLAMNTKIYGMFRPQIFGITAIRHTVTPSVSYNYRPDFSKPFWNYYKNYKNQKGEEILYNVFEREVFGGAGSGEQQAVSFSVGNNFEMKLARSGKDTTSEQTKIQLLNFDLGSSYNFVADSLKFSDVRMNFYTNIGTYLSIGGSANFTLYKYADGLGFVNKFLINEGAGLMRLTNFSFSLSTSLTSEQFKTKNDKEKESDTLMQSTGIQSSLGEQIRQQQEKGVNYDIPWNLSLNYSYSLSKTDPKNEMKYSNLGLLLSFNLTKHWKFSVSGNYDVFEKQITAPVVRISRDLHCWDMNFEWYPIGSYRGFRFNLRVKAPQLQDLKVEKSGGVFSR